MRSSCPRELMFGSHILLMSFVAPIPNSSSLCCSKKESPYIVEIVKGFEVGVASHVLPPLRFDPTLGLLGRRCCRKVVSRVNDKPCFALRLHGLICVKQFARFVRNFAFA